MKGVKQFIVILILCQSVFWGSADYVKASQSIEVMVTNEKGYDVDGMSLGSLYRFKFHFPLGISLTDYKTLHFRPDNEPFEIVNIPPVPSLQWEGEWTPFQYEEPPVNGDILVEIFKQGSAIAIWAERLSVTNKIYVSEPGAYIVRCTATIQIDKIEDLSTGIPQGTAPSGIGYPPCVGSDAKGSYEIFKMERVITSNQYAFRCYKRYTYTVISDTLTDVRPGENDKAFVCIPNDPAILGGLAEGDSNKSGSIDFHLLNQGDVLTNFVVKETLKKSIKQYVKLQYSIGPSFLLSASSTILYVGTVPDEELESESIKGLLKVGAKEIIKGICIKYGATAAAGGTIAEVAVVLPAATDALIKLYEWNHLEHICAIASRDDMATNKVENGSNYDIYLKNRGLPLKNVKLATVSTQNNFVFPDPEYGIYTLNQNDICIFKGVPSWWFQDDQNSLLGYLLFEAPMLYSTQADNSNWDAMAWLQLGGYYSSITKENISIEPPQYAISASSGTHGAISPNGTTMADQGDTIMFHAQPDSGYQVDDWYVDGVIEAIGTPTFSLTDIQNEHDILVTFEPGGGNSNGSLIIDRPVTNPFETGETNITFSGRAPANTHHVTWENKLTGESGDTNDPPGTEWREGIGLFEGANTIIFKAWDASNQLLDEASIVVNRRNNIRQVDASCVGNCWISSGHPREHGAGEMYVGWNTNDGYLAERGLILFTLPGLPTGSSISNASFGARTSTLAYCAPNWPLNISIARITSNWNLSSVSWNGPPSYTEEDMSGAGIPPDHNTWSYWNATGIVQDWYGGASNYGMILIADSEGGRYCEERAFDYHDFRLVITYSLETTPPHVEIASPTSNPTWDTVAETVLLAGTAVDNFGVSQVRYVNRTTGVSGTAQGTASWTCEVPLVAGVNDIAVTATDAAGNSDNDTIEVVYLAAPTGVIASDDAERYVRVQWDPVAGSRYYQIGRSSSASDIPNAIGNWQETRLFFDTTIAYGNTYYYWVRASNSPDGALASAWAGPDIGIGFAPSAEVISVVPAGGSPGTAVKICGSQFGETPGKVFFDGRPSTVVTWSNTSIECIVPYVMGSVHVQVRPQNSLLRNTLVAWGQPYNIPVEPLTGCDYVKIAAGAEHALCLMANGSVKVWACGGSDSCDFASSIPAPNENFIAIAAGRLFSLALKADGAIVAWGRNDCGQCDVPLPNTGFVAIAAGEYHCLGLKADGSVVAWGSNNFGKCNVPVPNTGFVAIAAGMDHSLGLKSDGSVVAWGSNTLNQCEVTASNTGFIAISAGAVHSMGLKDDGAVVVWGGGCPDGPYSSSGAIVSTGEYICDGYIVPLPNSDFVTLAGGGAYCLGLKEDRSMVAFGKNGFGQCNIPVPNSGFVEIAAGPYQGLALRYANVHSAGCWFTADPTYVSPLNVMDVKINLGDAQRSNIGLIQVDFSESLDIDALVANDTIDDYVKLYSKTNSSTPLGWLNESCFQWNSWTNTLSIDLTTDGFGGSDLTKLTDGRYEVRFNASFIKDIAGNSLSDNDGVNDGYLTIDRTITGGVRNSTQDLFRFFGDADGDGDVDFADLFKFKKTYQKSRPDPIYNPIFDVDGDGDVDFSDLFKFNKNYQKVLP